eukprot:6177208-Pleurochrysis_carterae.AAC.2
MLPAGGKSGRGEHPRQILCVGGRDGMRACAWLLSCPDRRAECLCVQLRLNGHDGMRANMCVRLNICFQRVRARAAGAALSRSTC